ncbi:MAG: DUF4885 family protein [Velocimicrobium sp.]
MAIETAFYNYYNLKDRYTPETPQKPSWKTECELVTNKIQSTNGNPESEQYKIYERLENRYYAASVTNRSRYSTEDELCTALSKKYLQRTSEYYGKYDETERRAMYENELNMTLFGCLSTGGHPKDPNAGGVVSGMEDYEEQKSYNRTMVTTQINSLFEENRLSSLIGNNRLTFTINPLTYSLSVSGIDDENLKQQVEEILNKDKNSSELFFHIMRSSSSNISTQMRNKYLLQSEFYDATGQDLNDYIQRDGGFYDKEGNNALDIFKDCLFKSDSSHKGETYSYFEDLVERVSNVKISNVPDMVLSIGYKNGMLIDLPLFEEQNSTFDLKA